MDVNDNKKAQNLEEYYDKGDRYVLIFPRPQKESNPLIHLDKETKSFNYLVYIVKLPYKLIAIFVIEFLNEKDSKA